MISRKLSEPPRPARLAAAMLLLAVALLTSAPDAPAQESVRLQGVVRGTSSLDISNQETVIPWDFENPLVGIELAWIYELSNSRMGYEVVLISTNAEAAEMDGAVLIGDDTTDTESIAYQVFYGGRMVSFVSGKAVLSRMIAGDRTKVRKRRRLSVNLPKGRAGAVRRRVKDILILLIRVP